MERATTRNLRFDSRCMMAGTMSEKPSNRRKLPLGVEDFQTIRGEDYYYVDKTSFIRHLVEGGRRYFLSRPRRFGKSLLVHTLKDLFEGNESLFQGLDIHGSWDWSVKHPVVRLSFGGKYTEPEDLEEDILSQLNIIERRAGLVSGAPARFGPQYLRDLLDRLHQATGKQVVVLVDEYDKPILDALDTPELAKANRDYLRGFYGVLKDSTELVRFVFVTGVSMFSGLNNLEDISLNPQYATICGYTDEDIDTVFAAELPGLDREEIRAWYNGYHWLGEESLYNPYGILLLFKNRKFKPHWFATGTPSFLYRLMKEKAVSLMEMENRVTDEELICKFDVEDIGLEALLFQTGYLTIAAEQTVRNQTRYTLDYPNEEVRRSLSDGWLESFGQSGLEASDEGSRWCELLEAGDFEGFRSGIHSFLSGVPYQWNTVGDLGRYEAWYGSLVYACFQSAGVSLRMEESTGRGRSDMMVFCGGQVFVLEFKVVEQAGEAESAGDAALSQIRERGYAEKYRGKGQPVRGVAVVFGVEERNVLAVRAESA